MSKDTKNGKSENGTTKKVQRPELHSVDGILDFLTDMIVDAELSTDMTDNQRQTNQHRSLEKILKVKYDYPLRALTVVNRLAASKDRRMMRLGNEAMKTMMPSSLAEKVEDEDTDNDE